MNVLMPCYFCICPSLLMNVPTDAEIKSALDSEQAQDSNQRDNISPNADKSSADVI